MFETPRERRRWASSQRPSVLMTGEDVSAWFVREILPLEAILMHYLRHNWRNASDIADLRQEVYVRVFEAAKEKVPDNAKRFLLTCARNLLIDLVRREQVVPIEAVADLETLGVAIDAAGADRAAIARDELRRLEAAIAELPPRAREAITLAYVEGLTGPEIAARMGISKSTVSEHLAGALRTLTNVLYGRGARE